MYINKTKSCFGSWLQWEGKVKCFWNDIVGPIHYIGLFWGFIQWGWIENKFNYIQVGKMQLRFI